VGRTLVSAGARMGRHHQQSNSSPLRSVEHCQIDSTDTRAVVSTTLEEELSLSVLTTIVQLDLG